MATGSRFEGLDGLRGIAALAVLLHHAGPRTADIDLLPRGYLAVDFFFMLSGFVMASAYERRFSSGLEPATFLRARMARLYPLMAIGICLGAAAALAYGMPTGELSLRFVLQMLWVPLVAGSRSLFLLDGVQWSLFFEVFANLVHCAVLWRLTTARLIWVAAAALLTLVPLVWQFDGMALGDRGSNILGGIPRVIFAYTVGIIIFRLRDRVPRTGLPAPIVLGLMPLILFVAGMEIVPSAVGDLLVVAACFPAILMLGLSTSSCMSWAGRISFPLYAVHLPILYSARLFGTGPLVLVLAMAVAIFASFGLARLFEPPVKRARPLDVSAESLQPAGAARAA